MPIYEYQCGKCEGTFEAIQKFSDAPLTDCRLCEDGTVRKLLSAPAFRLKGSGWYETDFKKNGQRNVAKSDADSGSSKAAGADSAGTKSETKGSGDSAPKSEASGSGSKGTSGSGSKGNSSDAA